MASRTSSGGSAWIMWLILAATVSSLHDDGMNRPSDMGRGIAIGIAIGVVMGLALHNIAIGIAMGVAIGVAIGAGWSRRNGPDD